MSERLKEPLSRRKFITASAGLVAAATFTKVLGESRATAPTDRPLGWALVGLGSLSINQLLPALSKTKSARLAGLVSGHPDKANALAKKYSLDPKHIYNYENFDQIK